MSREPIDLSLPELRPPPPVSVSLAARSVVLAAAGLLVVAIASVLARQGVGFAPLVFWAGLLTVILPVGWVLLRADVDRGTRLRLVVLLGFGLYLVKLLLWPGGFAYFDEFHHWATLQDLLRTGHLFTPNNILPASPYYPGLEIATAPLVQFGLPAWEAGVVVVGLARVLMAVALFLFFELVSGGAHRVAGLASLVYMANPSFLFFDAQFAYESLALPMAILVLWAVARREEGRGHGRAALTLLIVSTIVAVVITHHITSIALATFLVAWAVIAWFVRDGTSQAPGVAGPALITAAATVAWTLYLATVTVGYLAPAFSGTVGQVLDLIGGEATGRELFRTATGVTAPAWEQALGFGSALLVLATLPFAILATLRAAPLGSAAVTLALAALLFPASLVARLTQSGAELSARSQEFIFLGVGFVLAHLAIRLADDARILVERLPRLRLRELALAGIAVLFVGGAIVGMPFWGRLPGPYLVSADPRSVEPQGIAAARWTAAHLGPDARFMSDRVNRFLLKTIGDQHPISAAGDRVDVRDAYFSPVLGGPEERVLVAGRVAYVLADRRMTMALPTVGVYVERGELRDGAHRSPLPAEAMAKWDDAEGADRIFDSGDIRIYDIRRLVETVE